MTRKYQVDTETKSKNASNKDRPDAQDNHKITKLGREHDHDSRGDTGSQNRPPVNQGGDSKKMSSDRFLNFIGIAIVVIIAIFVVGAIF